MDKPELLHLGVDPNNENFPKIALVCGDPGRVDKILAQLEHGQVITEKRGFRIGIGQVFHFGGLFPVAAVATGIGGPSTAVVIEELILCGVKTIIRVGTAGSYQPDAKQGDLLISTATIRHDGTSQSYTGRLGLGFPAVADLDVTLALRSAAEYFEFRHQVGITRHIDGFYPDNFAEFSLFPDDPAEMKKALTRAKVIGVSMESGTIFPLCYIRGIKAGEILAVTDKADENQHELVEGDGVDKAIKTAIRAIEILRISPNVLEKSII